MCVLFQIMVRALVGESLQTSLTSGCITMKRYYEPKILAQGLWL